MLTQPVSLSQSPLADLEQSCRHETRHYQRGEASDSRYCLEIFQRALRRHTQGDAVVYGDEAARNVLVAVYTDFVKAHINRSAASRAHLEDLVQQVWLHFWQAANATLEFNSLESALAYLRQTTVSTLVRQRRRVRQQDREESLQQLVVAAGDEVLADVSSDLFGQFAQERFRTRVREVLYDPLEYRVYWMRYGLSITPREIAQRLASEGVQINGRAPTPRLASDLLDRCFKRLSTDEEIRALLASD